MLTAGLHGELARLSCITSYLDQATASILERSRCPLNESISDLLTTLIMENMTEGKFVWTYARVILVGSSAGRGWNIPHTGPSHHASLFRSNRSLCLPQSRLVVITLTPFDGSAKRTLTLNPAKRHIEIGRASKTASKGLVACKDNAWFDSPIMSRTHAEILLVLTPERVSSSH